MAQRRQLRYPAQSGCVPNQRVFGQPGEAKPSFGWWVYITHSLKVFIYWNGQGRDSTDIRTKNYLYLIGAAASTVVVISKKVKKGNSKKILDL